jgi:CheY-like chemotaxis protein
MAAPAAYTILFVEDETPVRDLVIRILSEKGFRVFAASDAHEALRLLAAHPIDLLFTDVVMPGMDGVQLARQAKRLRPTIKVLFTTGYAQRAAERQAMRLAASCSSRCVSPSCCAKSGCCSAPFDQRRRRRFTRTLTALAAARRAWHAADAVRR